MEIRQHFTVEQDIATVWRALNDIRLVASCMPGAEIVSVSDDLSEVEGLMRAKVGPMSAAFAGKGRVTRDDARHAGTVEGTGADRNSSSRVQVKLSYQLEPTDGGTSTLVSIVASVVLSGPLAQFGKGVLINEIATQLTQQFAANLRRSFETQAPPKAADGEPAAAPAPAGELRPLQLLFAVLKARLRRLFGGA
ncbi:MAG: SRPBCC family protein [Rhizobiaceae bacterium]